MGIQNGTIMDGATPSSAGGTSVTLTSDGQVVTNGVHVIDAAVADYRVRPGVTFKTIQPKLDPVTGTYGKGKKTVSIVHPKILASGKQGFPTFRMSVEDYPEMTVAECDKLRLWAIQVLLDSDFTSFFRTGSLA